MSKFNKDDVNPNRDYNSEARDLIKGLSSGELVSLYEIVVEKLKFSQTPSRQAELRAVKKVIEAQPNLDRPRMEKALKGYGSKMAQYANPKHGNARKSSKKA
jgi:hypothetical protein